MKILIDVLTSSYGKLLLAEFCRRCFLLGLSAEKGLHLDKYDNVETIVLLSSHIRCQFTNKNILHLQKVVSQQSDVGFDVHLAEAAMSMKLFIQLKCYKDSIS